MFKGMNLKEKQNYLEKETNILEHLEELGKVNVTEVDNVEELMEVLESMNYITHHEDDFLVLDNKKEKEDARSGEVKRKLNKSKGGSGGYSYKISIPVDFIRELEMEDAEELLLSLEDESIVIRKIEI